MNPRPARVWALIGLDGVNLFREPVDNVVIHGPLAVHTADEWIMCTFLKSESPLELSSVCLLARSCSLIFCLPHPTPAFVLGCSLTRLNNGCCILFKR